MFARLLSRRKALARFALVGVAALATACAPVAMTGGGPQGPALVPGAPVPVALLVPAGGGPEGDLLARNLENGARLAAADLSGVTIDLRVYPTGGDPAQAAAAAQAAVAEGAAIVLGPLYGEESAAAALAVAPQGVNVLSFSTNPAFAGNNLFILGPTFQNTADRLVRFGRAQGIERFMVAHGNGDAGLAGRDAIVAAANSNGATVAAVEAYPLTQQGITEAAPRVLAAANAAGAQGLFTTADATIDLPVLAAGLSAAGYVAGTPRLLGLTRWNALPTNASLPALQGGLFAVPDQGRAAAFEARYRAAYGEAPLPPAALAFDGIAAIGALAAQGDPQALSRRSLTQGQGFQGTSGIFRLNDDGTNSRGLAVAEIRNNQVVIVDPAPASFAGAGL